jgi:hypothetical protein
MTSSFGHVEIVKLLLALPGIDYNHGTNGVRKYCNVDDLNPLNML